MEMRYKLYFKLVFAVSLGFFVGFPFWLQASFL